VIVKVVCRCPDEKSSWSHKPIQVLDKGLPSKFGDSARCSSKTFAFTCSGERLRRDQQIPLTHTSVVLFVGGSLHEGSGGFEDSLQNAGLARWCVLGLGWLCK
jgi:hypothetical protein